MYPIDYRRATLLLYDYFQSMRKTSDALKVSIASISRWSKRIDPKKKQGIRTKLSDAMVICVQHAISKDPSLKCTELVALVKETFNVSVSRQLVHMILKRLNYSFKRVRKRGISKQKESRKEHFLQEISNVPKDTLMVSIDDS